MTIIVVAAGIILAKRTLAGEKPACIAPSLNNWNTRSMANVYGVRHHV